MCGDVFMAVRKLVNTFGQHRPLVFTLFIGVHVVHRV